MVVGILRTGIPSSEMSRRHILKTWQGSSYANISVRLAHPNTTFSDHNFPSFQAPCSLNTINHLVMDPIILSAIILPSLSASIVDTMTTFSDTVVIVFIMNATNGRHRD